MGPMAIRLPIYYNKYGMVFISVGVIKQISIENGKPLFSVNH